MKVINGDVDLAGYELKKLPDLSDVKIIGNFNCGNSKVTSLKGAPMEVSGYFDCSFNPGKFTEDQVRAVCKVRGRIITAKHHIFYAPFIPVTEILAV